MANDQNRLLMGRIVGLFGVKGWLKVFSYTDPRQGILGYDDWWVQRDGTWTRKAVIEGKRQGKTVIARLDGIDDRDAAAEWIDSDIAIDRGALPEPGEGSFYWTDLEGCRVVTPDGQMLGSVAQVLETGANDVLVVRGDTERLIPFVMNDVIVSVDIDQKSIVADWEWD
ncbi:MAG: ribosome maturation factor RimM [Pseudomonadota bacterium]